MSSMDDTRRTTVGGAASLPPRDDLGDAIVAGADLDPIEIRVAMQRVRSTLTAPGEEDPVRIGRHLVVRKIAAGGFGVVYEAFDPELDRKLAVKVLRGPEGSGSSRRRIGDLLLDEARALAQVAHPNVVSVFDVGLIPNPGGEAQIYLAMEMVEGQSMRDWLREAKREWREVVSKFRDAGEGLAAAHEAGVIHRDFKPANVLLGKDGRVRVADFGLAIASHHEGDGRDEPHAGSGTPAYMAPEQHSGDPCDTRSDVYSFCVSLYEGLYGSLPFATDSLSELVDAKSAGPTTTERAPVPGWLRALVLRGLQPDPDERWQSVREMLALIDSKMSGRVRLVVGLMAGVVVAGIVGYGVAATTTEGTSASELCRSNAKEAVEASWGDERRERARLAFEATALAYAPAAWESTRTRLDRFAEHWSTRRLELCEAEPFLRKNAPTMLRGRDDCLAARMRDLDNLGKLLEDADRGTVQRAVHAAYALEDPDTCTGEVLDIGKSNVGGPAPDTGDLAIANQIASVRSLRLLGKYEEARKLAEAMEGSARASPRPATTIEALMELAWVRERAGDNEGAEALLEEVVRMSESEGLLRPSARARSRLVWVVGHVMARRDEGRVWAVNAESALARARGHGLDVRSLEATYLNSRGALHFSNGEHDEAFEAYGQARAVWIDLHGEDHPSVVRMMNNLGSVHFSRGELDEAGELFERVVEYRTRSLGAEHPNVASALANLGSVAQEQGDFERALEIAERVLELRKTVYEPDHPHMARAHHQLAVSLGTLGRYRRARTQHERALEIQRKALGEDHPDVAFSLNSLGSAVERLGELEEAERLYRAALAHVEEHMGADHSNAALTHLNLGDLLRRTDRVEEAIASHRRALDHFEGIDPQHPRTALALSHLSLDFVKFGKFEEAEAHARRALEIVEARGLDETRQAEGKLALGMAIWERGQTAEGNALVAEAAAIWKKHPGAALELKIARDWLRTHEASP
jgi:tetratricopeptide (TPR) repeat protein